VALVGELFGRDWQRKGIHMSEHSHEHAKNRHHNKARSADWRLHKDWRTWTAVLIMIAAVVMYVLSLDDSIVPR
jgi:hypothetical protein